VVETSESNYLIVATDLVEKLPNTFNTTLTIKATVKGLELEHTKYRHPLFDRESAILIGGDYVTTDSGTRISSHLPLAMVRRIISSVNVTVYRYFLPWMIKEVSPQKRDNLRV
jgi:hypothetical protein